MSKTLQALWTDENGYVITAELVLVVTLAVVAMVAGINGVATSINQELVDVGSAFGNISQSYAYTGCGKWGHSWVAGSAFIDNRDYCDNTALSITGAGYGYNGYYGGYNGNCVAVNTAAITCPTPCAAAATATTTATTTTTSCCKKPCASACDECAPAATSVAPTPDAAVEVAPTPAPVP